LIEEKENALNELKKENTDKGRVAIMAVQSKLEEKFKADLAAAQKESDDKLKQQRAAADEKVRLELIY